MCEVLTVNYSTVPMSRMNYCFIRHIKFLAGILILYKLFKMSFVKSKVKLSRYMPQRHMGGEEV
jgi:hypothetical protein